MLTTQESQGELSDSANVKTALKKQHSRGARLGIIQENALRQQPFGNA